MGIAVGCRGCLVKKKILSSFECNSGVFCHGFVNYNTADEMNCIMGMGFNLTEVIDEMKRVQVKVINKNGIHLRLAGEVVKNSSRFVSDIQIEKNTEQINAKSILGVASLGAEYGSELTIIADGEDEDQAINLLVDLFEKGFSEGEE